MSNPLKNMQILTFSNKFRQFLAFRGPQGGLILCHQSQIVGFLMLFQSEYMYRCPKIHYLDLLVKILEKIEEIRHKKILQEGYRNIIVASIPP